MGVGNLLRADRLSSKAKTGCPHCQDITDKHVGVIAWGREADIDLCEHGPLTVLFRAGEAPAAILTCRP